MRSGSRRLPILKPIFYERRKQPKRSKETSRRFSLLPNKRIESDPNHLQISIHKMNDSVRKRYRRLNVWIMSCIIAGYSRRKFIYKLDREKLAKCAAKWKRRSNSSWNSSLVRQVGNNYLKNNFKIRSHLSWFSLIAVFTFDRAPRQALSYTQCQSSHIGNELRSCVLFAWNLARQQAKTTGQTENIRTRLKAGESRFLSLAHTLFARF